jgi:hypothetical protein
VVKEKKEDSTKKGEYQKKKKTKGSDAEAPEG